MTKGLSLCRVEGFAAKKDERPRQQQEEEGEHGETEVISRLWPPSLRDHDPISCEGCGAEEERERSQANREWGAPGRRTGPTVQSRSRQGAGAKRRQPIGGWGGVGLVELVLPFCVAGLQPEEIEGDERDQEDMRVETRMDRESDQTRERLPKAKAKNQSEKHELCSGPGELRGRVHWNEGLSNGSTLYWIKIHVGEEGALSVERMSA